MIHLLASFAGAYAIAALIAMFRGRESVDIIHIGLLSGSLGVSFTFYLFLFLGLPL